MASPINTPDPGPLRKDEIVVVSGLPRSGTSMMMAMLAAGGIPLAADGMRTPDADNPRGYFELEAVKRLPEDTAWLAGCVGKAVKVISHLLIHLPANYPYRVIFMNRDLGEVMASQARMLHRAGKPHQPEDDPALTRSFQKHLAEVIGWLERAQNLAWLSLDYGEVIADPQGTAAKLAGFLGTGFAAKKAAAQVEPALYRYRRPGPGPA